MLFVILFQWYFIFVLFVPDLLLNSSDLLSILLLLFNHFCYPLSLKPIFEVLELHIIIQNATALRSTFAYRILYTFNQIVNAIDTLILDIVFKPFLRKIRFNYSVVLLEIIQVLFLIGWQRIIQCLGKIKFLQTLLLAFNLHMQLLDILDVFLMNFNTHTLINNTISLPL